MTAISVDSLLALFLGLRYREVVTLKKMYVVVIGFWVVSTVAATMYFWNFLITLWYSYIIILLSIVTSAVSYKKIFVSLRHHQLNCKIKFIKNDRANNSR